MIEKGRRRRPPLVRHERLCPECKMLGDEVHFITTCTKFSTERRVLFQQIINVIPNFENLDSSAKFIFVLSQEDKDITKMIAKYTFDCFKILENENLS